MPLLDIQRRFRELGRIRLGEKSEKGAPKRLNEFRLTSPSRDLLESAAAIYGGTVGEWAGAPTEGTQYELKVETNVLDVVIPPGEPISQFYEMWSGGGCQRRCDGFRNLLVDGPCECPADQNERAELSKKGKACKPTTRLSVILPRVPDIGVWRIETHGFNAAVELPGTVAILQAALSSGQMIPAQLRLEARTSKKEGTTQHFVVPVLELPTLTAGALMAGETMAVLPPTQQIATGHGNAPALGTGGGETTIPPVAQSAPASLPPFPEDDTPDSPLATPEQIGELRKWLAEVQDMLPDAYAKVKDGWKDTVGQTLMRPERFTHDHYVKAGKFIEDTVAGVQQSTLV